MNQVERLQKQIEFIKEIDKLKHILRQTVLMDASRQENDAEHTWHLAMMAMVLLEHTPEPRPNLSKVLKMLLVHDIVEIDAGDTFAYDTAGYEDKQEREMKAAERVFGLLPEDQKQELISLWLEFEERQSLEAKYAAAIDRIQPLLHNYYTGGLSWKKHGVRSSQVLDRISGVADIAPSLYELVIGLIQDAVQKGYLQE
ncbi:HD domain-containing protein [Paenibacillus motobuensis]|uniref:HD domain-containing protein n=1 Tax=Paenibacillus TaxID=44249 RepID=UPI00203C6AC6|nr:MULTISPECIES: HD domain-containing protein [Paenibacillus]MCM3038341.1 HD domain-containing protein [Paenibacillus lutimineralis]MCM3645445.1 HD domain-containing protein [Paenibacillus motobuensis]